MILSRSAHALFSCAIFVMAPDVCTSPRGSQRSRPEGNEDDFDPATSLKKSGKTPAKSHRSGLSGHSDPGFDMAADRLFHSHPV
jgi:hypothetical protein